MATIRGILGIICLIISWGFTMPSSNFLKKEKALSILRISCADFSKITPNSGLWFIGSSHALKGIAQRHFLTKSASSLKSYTASFSHTTGAISTDALGLRVLEKARSQLHIREATGKNDGLAVEAYLKYTGHQKGAPWCASFVSWVFGQVGFSEPRTAWSPALFPLNRKTKVPQIANVFGIYFTHLKRIAHCGIIERTNDGWVSTIEGNTNSTGLREGDGVYRKLRHQRTIAVYTDWISVLKKGELK